ncbi:protein ROOT INITIATION DEFECTIVE 3 [Argentina anserina]|uniref:protein ROOT INITIATION DEFECTIVE 3 n=1 Tax=Argentina anserina TaxID=57926 RepID=UPI0021762D88|nr:protein ROOT INITIATION DEFECTIVE 3 [Potentilla anserina]XP_050364699.1 protein ROOT INITIATION DEFECTIVE 3 [Potentilla anserina]
MEVVVASSSVDSDIACWDFSSGAELLRYKSCASPNHGLVSVGDRFLASSQTSGSVKYWAWSKPQPDAKSSQEEPIKPLAANREGTYVVGGGKSGTIYLWEVTSGRMLKKWDAHYRAVSCLRFSDDGTMLFSGSEDGEIRVWNLVTILDDHQSQRENHQYLLSFTEHSLSVTDMVLGFGYDPIIASASEDRTCKIWSFSRGTLLRNIVFPTIIDAIAMDPCENLLFAGGRDGNIYVAALNTARTGSSKYGLHIINRFSNHSKAVTCLAWGLSGNYLISGSEDGVVRVWDAKTANIVRVLRHSKGPVNNILVIRQQVSQMNPSSQASSWRHGSSLPPPLEKRAYEADKDAGFKAVIGLNNACSKSTDAVLITSDVMERQIRELQQQGSASAEMEIERLKLENKKCIQMVQQWKKMYDNLHQFCVNELVDGDKGGAPNENAL